LHYKKEFSSQNEDLVEALEGIDAISPPILLGPINSIYISVEQHFHTINISRGAGINYKYLQKGKN